MWTLLWMLTSTAWAGGWVATQEPETETDGTEESPEAEAPVAEPSPAPSPPPEALPQTLSPAVLEVAPTPGTPPAAAPESVEDPVPSVSVVETVPDIPLNLDFDDATEAQELSTSQMDWLQPRRHHLSPNPYAQTDFTAYTLEWGEVKIGLAAVTVGVLPRAQAGTSPVLHALSIPNGALKINLVRAGALDIGLLTNHSRFRAGEFSTYWTSVAARTSVIGSEAFSVHGSLQLNLLGAEGLPDLTQASPLLMSVLGVEPVNTDTWELVEAVVDPYMRAHTWTLGLATDYRLNRRDSLVFQGQTMVWRRVEVVSGLIESVPFPSLYGLDGWQDIDESGFLPLRNAYMASVAYHAAWKQLDMRLGLGASSLRGAWLLQSLELSYRFGGATRNEETRVRRAWRRNWRTPEGDQATD